MYKCVCIYVCSWWRCCVSDIILGKMWTSLTLTSGKNKNITKVQHDEPMNLFGLLTAYKWEVAYRSGLTERHLHHQKSILKLMTIFENWNPRPQHTTFRSFVGLYHSFPGSSADLYLSGSLGGLSISLISPYYLCKLWWKGPSTSIQF